MVPVEKENLNHFQSILKLCTVQNVQIQEPQEPFWLLPRASFPCALPPPDACAPPLPSVCLSYE